MHLLVVEMILESLKLINRILDDMPAEERKRRATEFWDGYRRLTDAIEGLAADAKKATADAEANT
jgi:Ni,Fe-hydrogenase III large subunit